MRRYAITMLFVAALSTAPCGVADDIPSPLDQPRAIVAALRANDVDALHAALSRDTREARVADWERQRVRQLENDVQPAHGDEAEVVLAWAMLGTQHGAVALGDAFGPRFATHLLEARQRYARDLPQDLVDLANDPDYTPDEAQQLSQLALAALRWAEDTDFADRARLDRALAEASGFVQRSGLASPREIPLLDYDAACALGGDALATLKRVLLAYGLDADAVLASIVIEEAARDGDRATLRWHARVLDVPITFTREQRFRHGRWADAPAAPYAEEDAFETEEDASGFAPDLH